MFKVDGKDLISELLMGDASTWGDVCVASQVALVVKNPPANAGDTEMQFWSLGWQDPLEEDSTLQYCFLENPIDRGAWWATVYRVSTSWTRLSDVACMWALGSGYWLLSSCYRVMWISLSAHGNFCCEYHAKMLCYCSSSSWGVFPDERQLSEGTHNFLKYLLLIHFSQTDSYNLLSHFMTQSNSPPENLVKRSYRAPCPSRCMVPCSVTYSLVFSVLHVRRHRSQSQDRS